MSYLQLLYDNLDITKNLIKFHESESSEAFKLASDIAKIIDIIDENSNIGDLRGAIIDINDKCTEFMETWCKMPA